MIYLLINSFKLNALIYVEGEAADFETVVLMKDSSSIKGTRFCHPGIDINPMSPFILKEFEMQVLSQSDVDVCAGENSKSLTEYYIKSLRDFFGSSCRPGRWTIVNTTIDLELSMEHINIIGNISKHHFNFRTKTSTITRTMSIECLSRKSTISLLPIFKLLTKWRW